MAHRAFLALLLSIVLSLSACGPQKTASLPPPQEPGPAATGHMCGMPLAEHAGPRGQVFLSGQREPLWFSSVADTMAYLGLLGAGERPSAVYVTDIGRADWDHPQPGTWVEARKAVYVVGSRRAGGMGIAEIAPFADPAAAAVFAKRYGGRVVSFAEVKANPIAFIEPTDENRAPSAR